MNNLVAQFRTEKGLTQQQLALHLEVSRQTIISIENGRYNPSLELAFEMAIFFKKRIEDVFLYSKGVKENE